MVGSTVMTLIFIVMTTTMTMCTAIATATRADPHTLILTDLI
ncbi:MAG TPA: hypothetical protein PLI59_16885 [Candidatus Obscuribacter sp.]|nr:hypothetical protein [Candidatus Obscuribacter sp.]